MKKWSVINLGLIIFFIALILLITSVSFTGRAISSSLSPSSCSGAWASCSYAFTDGSGTANIRYMGGNSTYGYWYNYNYNLPGSSTIDKIILRTDFFATNNNGYLQIEASNDGGLTYGQPHIFGGNTAEKSYFIDLINDFSWAPQSLDNSHLRIRARCIKSGGGANPACKIDWMPFNVTYTQFDFSISVNPISGSTIQGGSASATTAVTLLGGKSQPVSLSYAGCPPSSVCSFNTSSGSPTFSSGFSVATSSSTPAGFYIVTLIASGDGKIKSTGYVLTVNSIIVNITNSTNITGGGQLNITNSTNSSSSNLTSANTTTSSTSSSTLQCSGCGSDSGRSAGSGFQCNPQDGSYSPVYSVTTPDYYFCTCLSGTAKDCTIKGNNIWEPQESAFCETLDCGTAEQKASYTNWCSRKVCIWNGSYTSDINGVYNDSAPYLASCYGGENARATVCGNKICETIPENYASETESSCPYDCDPSRTCSLLCLKRTSGSSYRCNPDGTYNGSGSNWCTCNGRCELTIA